MKNSGGPIVVIGHRNQIDRSHRSSSGDTHLVPQGSCVTASFDIDCGCNDTVHDACHRRPGTQFAFWSDPMGGVIVLGEPV